VGDGIRRLPNYGNSFVLIVLVPRTRTGDWSVKLDRARYARLSGFRVAYVEFESALRIVPCSYMRSW